MVAPAGTAEIKIRGSSTVGDASNISESFPAHSLTKKFTTGVYTYLSAKIDPNWGERWKSAAKAGACILQYLLIATVGLIAIPATMLIDLCNHARRAVYTHKNQL